MEVGVVYDPCADELYQAVRGFGAFVNGQRASSSDCTELGNAVVVSEWGREGAAGENPRLALLLTSFAGFAFAVGLFSPLSPGLVPALVFLVECGHFPE